MRTWDETAKAIDDAIAAEDVSRFIPAVTAHVAAYPGAAGGISHLFVGPKVYGRIKELIPWPFELCGIRVLPKTTFAEAKP